MKDKLINKELLQSISPILAKPLIMKSVMKIGGFDKVNRIYDSAKHESGTDIEDAMIDGLGITRKVHNIEILKQFEGKPFITVSNHPYGHVDGIMLIGEVSKIRPDFKVMVNWMLGQIDIMQDHFIGVNPYSANISAKSSLNGLKECIRHLRDNRPLGFFPAGAISKTVGFNKIKDQEWQEGVLKLIQKAQVPIIPAYFSGQNSCFFNFLDRIDWRVRNVRLCHELDTKKGKTIDLVFGEPILPEEQKQWTDTKLFGAFLKERTYELAATLSPNHVI
jgi:putative hemolysin